MGQRSCERYRAPYLRHPGFAIIHTGKHANLIRAPKAGSPSAVQGVLDCFANIFDLQKAAASMLKGSCAKRADAGVMTKQRE